MYEDLDSHELLLKLKCPASQPNKMQFMSSLWTWSTPTYIYTPILTPGSFSCDGHLCIKYCIMNVGLTSKASFGHLDSTESMVDTL